MRRLLPLAAAAAVLLGSGCGAEVPPEPLPPLAPLGAATGAGWRAVWDMGGALDPSAENPCARGTPKCMDAVVAEMRRRLERQAATCDHIAPFALMYLKVTEEVARSVRERDYRVPGYAAHLDAAFATLYFRAADAWTSGRRDEVPRSWRLAFAAAERRELPALGNMLLGMNAHISRDLPYALAGVGLKLPDGGDATPDVIAVNRDIGRAQDPAIAEVARRYDPGIRQVIRLGRYVDPESIGDVIAGWRLEAIRNARALIAADTPAARRAVDARIDANATTRALMLWRIMREVATPAATAERERWCADRTAQSARENS